MKNALTQQLFEIGKLPPQATDLEEAVLGALMLEKDALTTVIDILQPRSFYKESHGRIFSAIQNLFQRSEPIDILTVTNELKRTGELEIVGGAYFISSLTNRIATGANIEYYARIVSQKYIQRELIRISTDTIKDAYEDTADVFDLLDSAEQNLFSIIQGNIKKNYEKLSTAIGKVIKNTEEAAKKTSGVTGVPSGFNALDRVTNGWQDSDLVIVAARPAMGKTSFALNIARNAAVEYGKNIAVFSLEMTTLQLVQRLVSSEASLNSRVLKTGRQMYAGGVEETVGEHFFVDLHSKIARLTEAPIFIDDTPAISVLELRAKARRLKDQHDISLIVIDYLQLMTSGAEKNKGGNREQEISNISRSLKQIAKELNVPVIALSQLSRAVESRGGAKRPQLSDLRESGAIEQDADMVIFIHRPEYYGFTKDENGNSTLGLADIIIAKHRNGSTCDVELRFIEKLTKFEDISLITEPYNPNAGITNNVEFTGTEF